MAEICFGAATSHGPMLTLAPAMWQQRAEYDRVHTNLIYRGACHSFDDLVRLRSAEGLESKLTPCNMEARFMDCQRALDQLGQTIMSCSLDALVIIGDDQHELFHADNMPVFSLYAGAQIDHLRPAPNQVETMQAGIASSLEGRYPDHPMKYSGVPELAEHMIRQLVAEHYDVSCSYQLPLGRYGDRGIPHAFGFVYTRLLGGHVLPNIPVFINTFYPPNQPTLERCISFGRALARVVTSWGSDFRVGVVASGGLSHYVVDESLDHEILGYLGQNDMNSILKMPSELFTSGNSEIRNWLAIGGAMDEAGLSMETVDYAACYRSLAGTGSGMGFAQWR